MNYIVAVDYFSNEQHRGYDFFKLDAKNTRAAQLEAPAVAAEKVGEGFDGKVFCLRILKQTVKQEQAYEATDCNLKYIPYDHKWIPSQNGNTWYNVEAE